MTILRILQRSVLRTNLRSTASRAVGASGMLSNQQHGIGATASFSALSTAGRVWYQPTSTPAAATNTTITTRSYTTPEYSIPGYPSLIGEIVDANERFEDKIKIQPWSETSNAVDESRTDEELATLNADDHDWCVLAKTTYQPGDVVIQTRIMDVSDSRHSHTLQAGRDKHVLIDLPSRFINHSCDPNMDIHVKTHEDSTTTIHFTAAKTITPGEHLSWDYECTEDELDNAFDCCCGSVTCRGKISGFMVRPEELLAIKKDKISPHLLEMLA